METRVKFLHPKSFLELPNKASSQQLMEDIIKIILKC